MRLQRLDLAPVLITAVAALCLATTCAKPAPPPKAPTPTSWSLPSWFDRIPADTPYLVASVEPLPQEYVDAMLSRQAPLWRDMSTMLRTAFAQAAQDGQFSVNDKLIHAILEEYFLLLEPDRMGDLLNNPRFALYGLDIFPVLIVELRDPNAFRALVARIEQKIGSKVTTRNLGGQDYWSITLDRVEIALALAERQLVVSLFPVEERLWYLPRILGQKKTREEPSIVRKDEYHRADGLPALEFRIPGLLPVGAILPRE